MKNIRKFFFSVGAIVLTITTRADVLIDNFNAQRAYPPCCDSFATNQFGTYLSFESNVTQNGSSGTLRIDGTGSDNGGFYRDSGGTVLWNFTAQTNLLLTAKRLPGNTASNCWIVFRDINSRSVAYSFRLASFPTNAFGTLTNSLSTPAWGDGNGCDLAYIVAVDVHGGMTDEDLSFQLEIDEIKAAGPAVTNGPAIMWSFETNTLILSWNSPTGTAFHLQSSVSLPATWGTETNIQTNGLFSTSVQAITGTNKFFRLVSVSGSSLTSPLKSGFLPPGNNLQLFGTSDGSGKVLSECHPKDITLPTNSFFSSNFLDVASNFVRLDWFYWSYGSGPPGQIQIEINPTWSSVQTTLAARSSRQTRTTKATPQYRPTHFSNERQIV